MMNPTRQSSDNNKPVADLPSGYNLGFSDTQIPYNRDSLAAFSRTRCLPKNYRINELRKIVNDLHRKSRLSNQASRRLERDVEAMIRDISREDEAG